MTSNCSFLECAPCRTKLTKASNICFYVKDEKNVHISVKPEKEYVIRNEGKICFKKPVDDADDESTSETITGSSGSNKRRKPGKDFESLKCIQCSTKVGSVLPYGPQNAKFLAFSRDSVRLCGVEPLTKKKRKSAVKLWQVFRSLPQWAKIDQRNDSNFRQVRPSSLHSETGGKAKTDGKNTNDTMTKDVYPLVFPNATNAAHYASTKNTEDQDEMERLYGWQSLDIATPPRSYQISCYLEALHRDLIIVLPTGMGKTLIATMVLRKLQSLNPNRMSLFVVDRVPLVFQQGSYIKNQTGGVLRVCMLCGENKSLLIVRGLKEGAYDVLVITAGALLNMVQKNDLDLVSMFSCIIFDECHHATGQHVYTQLLEKMKSSLRLRHSGDSGRSRACPRIIGLTASPISANNIMTASKRLEELCNNLNPTQQCHDATTVFTPEIPSIHENHVNVEQVEIERPKSYISYACWVIGKMEKFRTLANSYLRMISRPNSANGDMMFLEPWSTGCHANNTRDGDENGVVLDEDMFDEYLSASSLGRVRGSINTLRDYIWDMECGDDGGTSCLPSSSDDYRNAIQYLNGCLDVLLSLLGALEFIDVFGTKFVSRVISDIFHDSRLQNEEIWEKQYPLSLVSAYKSLKRGVSIYKQSDTTSPRLKRLEHELRKVASLGDKKSRVLVLVHSRVVARELTEHLNSIQDLRNSFRAEMVVGHGGFDGMAWEGEQEEALRKFRLDDDDESSSRLLVATSVLEEGLDVAECDLVVQLQGVKCSTSFIQSRGRARRMKRSRMLIFSTSRDFARLVKVRNQENVMKLIVQQRSTRSIHFQQIEKKMVLSYGEEGSGTGEENTLVNGNMPTDPSRNNAIQPKYWHLKDDKTLVSTIWILPGKIREYDEEAFEELLQKSFESCGLLQFHITNIVSIQNSPIQKIFDGGIGFLVGFSCVDPAQQQIEVASSMNLNEWNYNINGDTVWVQQSIAPVNNTSHVYNDGEVPCISFGNWMDPNTFQQRIISGHGTMDGLIILSVKFEQKEGISIEVIYNDERIGIEIPHTTIFDFTLFDHNKRLYVPLKASPLLYVLEGLENPEWIREADPMRLPFLDGLAMNNVICITFSTDAVNVRPLLAVPVFETKVDIVDSVDEENIDVFSLAPLNDACFLSSSRAREIAGRQKFPPPLFDVDHDKMRDIQWMLLSLFSQKLGCLTPHAKNNIWKFVSNIVDSCAEASIIRFASDKLEVGSEQFSIAPSEPDPVELSWLFYALNQCMNLSYWADVEQCLKSCFESIQNLDARCTKDDALKGIAYNGLHSSPETNQFKIYRLICTPTRLIYEPPLMVSGSRLYRKYGSEPFVSVLFRDDNFQRLRGSRLMCFVKDIVSKNIIIPGRKLTFFGASNRQLRDQQLLFVDLNLLPVAKMKNVHTYDDVENIEYITEHHLQLLRDSIVKTPTTDKYTAPQLLSKLALYCTSDTPTVIVLEKDVTSHPDIYCPKDGSVLTDGAGAICRSMASIVCSCLKLSSIPAAFQIRWRGVKGIVVVVEDDSPLLMANNQTSEILYAKMMIRPSMKKCEIGIADDSRLCVVDHSRILPLHLNREIITLLCSIKHDCFDPYPALLCLMEKALEDEAEMFTNTESGLSAVKGKLNNSTLSYFRRSCQFMSLLNDPMWVDILQSQYKMTIRDIIEKTRIPVRKGVQAVGIPDPVGVLKDGEIFVFINENICSDYSKEPMQKKHGSTHPIPWVLERENVLLWRNPCLHPGDVQIVRAVNYDALHPWCNVVIFPAGKCEKNIPLACSGGDLDGDKFYVLWDDNLIPPRDTQVLSMPYHEFGCEQRLVDPILFNGDLHNNEKLASFICDVFRNDLLGRIAHIHLALSDSQRLGARDPVCCEIAKAQSYAVDFPKTGIAPCVPKKALELIEEQGYPDFMGKGKGVSYPSKRPLGFLFRRARSFDFFYVNHGENGSKGKADSIPLDPRLLLAGREQFREYARYFHSQYSNILKCLMVTFGLKSEGECLLGRAISWHPLIKNFGDANKTLHSRMEMTQHYFREVFDKLSVCMTPAERQSAASAWYEVAYSESTKIRSFAIVVGDILVDILSERANKIVVDPCGFEERVGRSALHHYYIMQPHLLRWTQARQAVFESIRYLLLTIRSSSHSRSNHEKGVCLFMFGSVANGLCTENSDVDMVLCVEEPAKHTLITSKTCPLATEDYQILQSHDRQCIFLETYATPALQEISNSCDQIFDARVPIVRSVVDTSNVSCHGESRVNVDVSCNVNALMKTLWLQRLFLHDPAFYVAFYIITSWFREAHLVGKMVSDTAKPPFSDESISPESTSCTNFFSTGECQALILHLLEDELRDANKSCLDRWRNQYERDSSLKYLGTDFFDRVVNYDESTGTFLSKQSLQRIGMLILRFFENAISLAGDQDSFISFEWPCPEEIIVDGKVGCMPGLCDESLRTKIDLRRIRILAMFCGPARQCLLVCNDIKQLLEHAAGNGNISKFTCRLPTSLSYMIGPATDFVSQRLAFASGCSVKIESLSQFDGKMKLFAEGTRCCVLKLRQELNEITRGTLHKSRTKRAASVYFMEESSGIWLLGCKDAQVQMKFKDIGEERSDTSLLQYHRQKVNELSVCRSVNTALEIELSKEENRITSCNGGETLATTKCIMNLWGTQYSVTMADMLAIRELSSVFVRQVGKMPSLSSFSGVNLSVSFGNFVVVNKSRILPDTRTTLSLKEIHEGMLKAGRCRRRWERNDPNQIAPEEHTQKKESSGGMIELKTNDAKKKTERNISRRQRQKPGVLTTFIPTFGVQTNKNDIESSLMEKYESALDLCGYRCIHASDENIDGGNEILQDYTVKILLSKRHEVKARFSKAAQHHQGIDELIDVRERELNWVHFTLLGNGVLPDVRIRLSSTAPISPKLRKLANVEQSPIYWERAESKSVNFVPKFHSHVPRDQRQKIDFVRRTVSLKEYEKKDSMSNIHAKILFGFEYWKIPGKDDCWTPCTFCSLKLEYQDPLGNIGGFDSKEIAFSIVRESQMLGSALADCGVSFGD